VASDEAQKASELARRLMKAVHSLNPLQFVGLGIVAYSPPLRLPAVPLGGWMSERPTLPIKGTSAISQCLGVLSSRTSQWHDGFHFIDADSAVLTHVSQYLAPSLDQILKIEPAALPTGARQLTALLISGIESVRCVALLTADKHITIYQEGRLVTREPADHA
jgi:hypothetical protein